MKGEDKTKEQLLNEPEELPKQITELEASDKGRKRAEDALRKSEDDVQISKSQAGHTRHIQWLSNNVKIHRRGA